MNKDNIRKTIELLRESENYDQNIWATACGTPGCIAGHAVVACGGELMLAADGHVAVLDGVVMEIPDAAADLFGMGRIRAHDLFSGTPFAWAMPGASAAPPSREDAIATLERLAETGRVRWVRAGA